MAGDILERVVIREATPDDVPAIARVHVAAWNATYARFLARGPSVAVREQQWRALFARPDGSWFCYVVESEAGELVGFAMGRVSDHPEYDGELNKIYLLRDYQRQGLGRRLVGLVARRFLSEGKNSMWLSGDARNPSAKAWIALGATKTDDDPGNGNYGWKDLRILIERCRHKQDSER